MYCWGSKWGDKNGRRRASSLIFLSDALLEEADEDEDDEE